MASATAKMQPACSCPSCVLEAFVVHCFLGFPVAAVVRVGDGCWYCVLLRRWFTLRVYTLRAYVFLVLSSRCLPFVSEDDNCLSLLKSTDLISPRVRVPC